MPYCAGYQLSEDGKCMSMYNRLSDGTMPACKGEDCRLFCAYLWELRAFNE